MSYNRNIDGQFHVNSHKKKHYFFLELSLPVVHLEDLTVNTGLTGFLVIKVLNLTVLIIRAIRSNI